MFRESFFDKKEGKRARKGLFEINYPKLIKSFLLFLQSNCGVSARQLDCWFV